MMSRRVWMQTQKKSIKAGSRVTNVGIYIVLTLLCFVFVFPLWQAFVCSVSSPSAVASQNGVLLLPQGFQFDAYRMVFKNKHFWSGLRNSVFYVLMGTMLQYLVTVLAAYALSIRGLRFKKAIAVYFIITMFFSGGMIPLYLLVHKLKLANSVWALILPTAVNIWGIIIMKTQFSSIPQELRDAAEIDGAGDTRILFKIYLPVSRAVSAVLILFTAVNYWNMWFEPLLYMTERASYPLQSILREILIENSPIMQAGSASSQAAIAHGADRAAVGRLVKYACIMISSVPVLVAYPFLQKYFTKGVMLGSLDD